MDEWDAPWPTEPPPEPQDTRDPDYFEGPDECDGDEDGEIEARLAAYENWLGRT